RSAYFVSSRRRHTRFSRDWSSDVCSSDLIHQEAQVIGRHPNGREAQCLLSAAGNAFVAQIQRVVACVNLNGADSSCSDRVYRPDAIERTVAITRPVSWGKKHADFGIAAAECWIGKPRSASRHLVPFNNGVERTMQVSELESEIALAA